MLRDLQPAIDRSDVVGCAIGVLESGMPPAFTVHGESVAGETMSIDAIWEAASLSKPVVALLAATQVLSDPDLLTRALATDQETLGVRADSRWCDINLRHLLTHSSGLPNWRQEGRPLQFEANPGTPGYSGEGYELALSVLSSRSGLSPTALLDQLLADLGMESSSFTPDLAEARSVVVGHDESGANVTKHTPDQPKAAGSLHTTVEDYTRFLQTIAVPGTGARPGLQDAARRLTDREVEVFPGFGRTLGWAFAEGDRSDGLWQHGDNPGFKHVAAVRPSTGEAIVVFINDDNGQPLYRQLCKDFLDVEVW